jgi:hypothetical protein
VAIVDECIFLHVDVGARVIYDRAYANNSQSPLFWYLGWMQAYPGYGGSSHATNNIADCGNRTYLATYFTVRSRALGSLLYAIVGTLATWLAGLMVDLPWTKDRRTRAITTYVVIALVTTSTWIWAIYIQNEYRFTKPVLDFANQSTFGRGFGIYLFERWSTPRCPRSNSYVEHC